MSGNLLKLDCTDFLLSVGGQTIVVHEFEGVIALCWHLSALAIENQGVDSDKKVDKTPVS